MESVEVKFVVDSQSRQTGNEFYPAGTLAHFFVSQADALVESGQAVFSAPPADSSPLPSDPEPTPIYVDELHAAWFPDYSAMTVKELRKVAKGSGVDITGLRRKADLISALEGST